MEGLFRFIRINLFNLRFSARIHIKVINSRAFRTQALVVSPIRWQVTKCSTIQRIRQEMGKRRTRRREKERDLVHDLVLEPLLSSLMLIQLQISSNQTEILHRNNLKKLQEMTVRFKVNSALT